MGADRVVGLCVEKSVEEVGGMVGIMRCGAAYVPLDAKLPVERLRFLVEQCGCGVVVSQRKYCGLVEPLGAEVVEAEAADEAEDRGQPSDRLLNDWRVDEDIHGLPLTIALAACSGASWKTPCRALASRLSAYESRQAPSGLST